MSKSFRHINSLEELKVGNLYWSDSVLWSSMTSGKIEPGERFMVLVEPWIVPYATPDFGDDQHQGYAFTVLCGEVKMDLYLSEYLATTLIREDIP